MGSLVAVRSPRAFFLKTKDLYIRLLSNVLENTSRIQMIIFKQKIQVLNRITIPKEIMEALQLKQGDDVQITCDEDQTTVYLLFNKDIKPMFNRKEGITTIRENISYRNG